MLRKPYIYFLTSFFTWRERDGEFLRGLIQDPNKALMNAIKCNHIAQVYAALLSADVNHVDEDGLTPLLQAARKREINPENLHYSSIPCDSEYTASARCRCES